MSKIKNATQLRDSLLEVFEGLQNNTVNVKYATAVSNTAGKIISSAKAQLLYAQLKKEVPKIPFLDSDS